VSDSEQSMSAETTSIIVIEEAEYGLLRRLSQELRGGKDSSQRQGNGGKKERKTWNLE
jgi:hypothetical protein